MILQFAITFKDRWHFLNFTFSEDKDSDGKEKKAKSKEKDKKKEPASMFQINGEKDSKSKKKGDYTSYNSNLYAWPIELPLSQ